jgi:DNA-binding NarL/FixJ family response regulator
MKEQVGIRLSVAVDSYAQLLASVLKRDDLYIAKSETDNVAHVLIDLPVTWAFEKLEELNSIERARTVVLVLGTHTAYSDIVASYHISGVVAAGNEAEIISSIYAAAAALRTYNWKSSLTYMELRVSRLLLKGYDTEAAAKELRVSTKTINAHVSNAIGKLGCDSRAQYVAALLGQHRA